MKKLFFILVIALLSNQVMAFEVPDAIESAFEQKFPNAKKVKWEKEEDGNYEAEFILNDQEMSATFSPSATLLETETELEINELPQKVQDAFKSNYPTAKILEAAKITMADGIVYYETEAKINGKKTDVLFSPDGQLKK